MGKIEVWGGGTTVLSILMDFANNFNYLSPNESHIWILKF